MHDSYLHTYIFSCMRAPCGSRNTASRLMVLPSAPQVEQAYSCGMRLRGNSTNRTRIPCPVTSLEGGQSPADELKTRYTGWGGLFPLVHGNMHGEHSLRTVLFEKGLLQVNRGIADDVGDVLETMHD